MRRRSSFPDGQRLAFSTDTFVVAPWRFPGGSIGHLAVNGTVNDVAVQGGRPAWLSAAFVIEEGFPVSALRGIVADMAAAAAVAGVAIVTGDTKVVGSGAADGIFVTTAGLGVIPTGRALGPELVRPGDNVIVSGTIGDHGMAVMLARGNLALEADIRSDTAPLNGLVEALLAAAPHTRWLRDPDPRRRRHRVQRARPRRRRRRRAGRARLAREPGRRRRLRPPRHRPPLRRQRRQARRRRRARRGRPRRRRPCGPNPVGRRRR